MHFFPPKTLNPGWANSKLGWAKHKKNWHCRAASFQAQPLSQYLLQCDFVILCCSFCHNIIVAYRVLPKFLLIFLFIKCPYFGCFKYGHLTLCCVTHPPPAPLNGSISNISFPAGIHYYLYRAFKFIQYILET